MEEETVVMHNTSDHSLVLGSPLWGSLYGAELTCWQNELPEMQGREKADSTDRAPISTLRLPWQLQILAIQSNYGRRK